LKEKEREVFEQHCKTWSSFWGRPGYGAPRTNTTHKGNLFALLNDPARFYSDKHVVTGLAAEHLPPRAPVRRQVGDAKSIVDDPQLLDDLL
jgi:hypothetical protein